MIIHRAPLLVKRCWAQINSDGDRWRKAVSIRARGRYSEFHDVGGTMINETETSVTLISNISLDVQVYMYRLQASNKEHKAHPYAIEQSRCSADSLKPCRCAPVIKTPEDWYFSTRSLTFISGYATIVLEFGKKCQTVNYFYSIHSIVGRTVFNVPIAGCAALSGCGKEVQDAPDYYT